MPVSRTNFRLLLFTLSSFLVLVSGIFLVQRRTGIFSRAFGKPANILVDAGSSFTRSSYSWRNLAQGGEEDGRMFLSCLPQVSKLKPEYIRIDHVLDFYNVVSRDNAGNIIFNWQKLDQTLADILSVGAKPFISISYMPPAISSGGGFRFT